MSLFTVIMEYRGGTYIAQVQARTREQALSRWARKLDLPRGLRVTKRMKKELVHEVEDKSDSPMPIDLCQNVWCKTALVGNHLALINIVRTHKGRTL